MSGVQIGFRDLYYALLTSDTVSGVTYGAPVRVPGAIAAKINPKSNIDFLYSDDGASETITSMGGLDVEIEMKDLDIETQAALLGHTVANGVLQKKTTDIPPYVALGFRSIKSNGKYRYVWLYKGKFAEQDQEYKTMEEKPSPMTPKIKGAFVKRDFDSMWQSIADEDSPTYTSAVGTNWFTTVGTGPADTTPPTISSVVPANNATAVAVSTAITWTFSEALLPITVNASNFLVTKNDGTSVAGTVSLDGTQKIVTFTPSANLGATSTFLAIATTNVADVAGNKLAAQSITKFTTA